MLIPMLLLAAAAPASLSANECGRFIGQTIVPTSFEGVRARLPVQPPKSAFESTAEYQARLAQPAVITPVVLARDETQGLSYDADKQILSVYPIGAFGFSKINFANVFGRNSGNRLDDPFSAIGFQIGVHDLSREQYETTNGFGARVTVERRIREVRAVWERPGNRGESPFVEGKSLRPYQLKLSPDAARDLVEHGSSAFIVVPKPPFVGTGKSGLAPTFQYPIEHQDTIVAIVGDIRCALLLNGSRKAVFALTVR